MTDETLAFYKANAEAYTADDDAANPRLFPFLDRCKPGGRLLELGTGGGTDAAAILGKGFDLDATDGSSELAAIAARRIGRPVRTMLFQDLGAIGAYDGVYACAALTHLPRAELPGVIASIFRALVDGGIVWASFKSGEAEGADPLGRHYNYLSEAELVTIWREAAPWKSIEAEVWLGGAYDRRPTGWVAITAIRQAATSGLGRCGCP